MTIRSSQLLIPTLREPPKDAEVISHQLMVRAGYIRKLAAGVYTYLPLCLRVLRKIETIVREEMVAAGAQELLLPIVMPAELWQESGRWNVYGKELLRFKDRHDRDFCFGPTHEEAITDVVRNEVRSYRDLPKNCFQIQTKFRDEIRPRFGLMRGREFIMKDSYSFDVSPEKALQTYGAMYAAYNKIFTRCGLTYRAVEALTGNIGGSHSHEFQVLAQSGEDEIVACTKCEYAANIDKAKGETCPKCKSRCEKYRGIEVGQTFYLGTKYSESMKATFIDEKGKERFLEMGCYGIGIGRTAAAAIEQNHDEKGIMWPFPIAPFHVQVIPLAQDGDVFSVACDVAEKLEKQGLEVLMDDRDERPGVKFSDADLVGIPFHVVIGAKGLKEGKVELKVRRGGVVQHVPPEKIFSTLRTALEKVDKE